MKSLLAIIVASMLASALTSRALAQWTVQNSGIPTSDQVVLAAVNQNVCWGVTRATGGRYVTRTTNGGTDWVASHLTSLNDFSSIAAVGADTAWISTSGVYKTTNGGVNWTQQLVAGPMQIVRFFDSNNGVCIGDGISVSAEIYTTTNKGTTWTQVQSSNIPFLQSEGFIPDNAFVRGNAIWVPTNGGSLYKSTDRGLTWNVTRPVVNQGTGSFCAFKDSLNGLLSSAASNVVKRTTDGGANWTPIAIPAGVSPLFMSYVPGTNGSYMVTSVNPPGALTGSAYTLNSGATWTTVDNVTHGKAAFVSPSVGWSWGGANVIYKWTGQLLANKWTAQNSGIPTDDQVVLAAVDANVCWGVTRATGGRYVIRTTNGGTDWVASHLTSLNDFSSIAALSADTAWISTSGVYKTTNGGMTWTQPLVTTTPMLIVHFFDSNNGVCIGSAFAGPIEVYTTTDRGSVWTQVSNIPSAAGGAIPANYAAVGNTLWCPTNGGSLYKTTDRGITWSVTQNVGGTSGGIFVAFKDAANGLATISNTVFRTNDGGANWTSTGSVPNGVSAFLPSYIPGTGGSYMITSNPYPIPRLNGSAYTLDNGATWTTVDTLIHGRAAFVSPSVGWSWGGANVIYKWTGPPLVPPTSVRETKEIAEDFRLEQNYPNPFNPSTKIGFRVSDFGFVSLKVYDVLGREVRTLVNENLKTGSYETTFDASGLASGVYFYRLQTAGFVETKKLMLLR